MSVIRVVRKVKMDGKWTFLAVAKSGEKLDWKFVVHRGVNVVSKTGTFYLDYQEKGKRMRRAVGNHEREARAALIDQTNILGLRESGVILDDAPAILARNPATGPKIEEVVTRFKDNPPLKYRRRSFTKYRNALESFQSWCPKTHLSQLDRQDLSDFMSYLVVTQGLDTGTAVDKAHIIHSVMNDHGADIRMKKGDWPRVTEKGREPYKPEILKRLFSACTVYENTLFQTFLMTGFRDQEVGFLGWHDFDPEASTLRVSKKLHLGFDPKNYQERIIPIPDKLVGILRAHRKTLPTDAYLIFPTSAQRAYQGRPGGQRDKHMLRDLKSLAYRAGLNCGKCTSIIKGVEVHCSGAPVCDKFGLHLFRHTYATSMLHDGVDLVSLQFLLGHNDLDSTRKYLKALQPAGLLSKINLSSISTRFSPDSTPQSFPDTP